MIELNENTLTITKSAEEMIGFLLFFNGAFETVPFETGTDHAIKSNLSPGIYVVKEYNTAGDVFDLGEVEIPNV